MNKIHFSVGSDPISLHHLTSIKTLFSIVFMYALKPQYLQGVICSFIYTVLRCTQAEKQLIKASPADTALLAVLKLIDWSFKQVSSTLKTGKTLQFCTAIRKCAEVLTSQFTKEEFQNSKV